MSDRVRGDASRGPVETENQTKMMTTKEVLGNSSRDLLEWLEEFKDNLVDESVPEHRDASSSSREHLQSREQTWYRVSTAFLIVLRTTEIATSA